MRFKAIFMDNDGTLMDFKAGEANALRGIIRRLGIDNPAASGKYEEINDRCWKDFEKGLITQPQLRLRRFRELMEEYSCPGDAAETAAAYEAALAKQAILLPGALDAVQRISEKLPVLILTNGISHIQHGRIDASPLAPFLSGLLISEEIGAPKPAPDMFIKALEMAGVQAHEALMIGDSLTSDIQGAINAGVSACWYNPAHKRAPHGMRIDFEIDRIEQMPEVALMD